MNKLFYPAIFHKDEGNGFWVSFPDFPECLTEGDGMEKAYEMAVDALGLAISCRKKEGNIIPSATRLDEINSEDGIIVIVEFDMLEYCKKHKIHIHDNAVGGNSVFSCIFHKLNVVKHADNVH